MKTKIDAKMILAHIFTIFYCSMALVKLIMKIDDGGLVNSLTALELLILGYYFRSTESSRHKDKLLSQKK